MWIGRERWQGGQASSPKVFSTMSFNESGKASGCKSPSLEGQYDVIYCNLQIYIYIRTLYNSKLQSQIEAKSNKQDLEVISRRPKN